MPSDKITRAAAIGALTFLLMAIGTHFFMGGKVEETLGNFAFASFALSALAWCRSTSAEVE